MAFRTASTSAKIIAVVKELKLKLLTSPSVAVSSNIEVYNLILQGNYFYDKLDKDNVAKAIDFYKQALAIDSTDARVWGKLAKIILTRTRVMKKQGMLR